MKPTALRRLNTDDVSKAEIEMAKIAQNQREWRSPWPDVPGEVDSQGRNIGWQPVDTNARNPLSVDEVLNRYRIVLESEVGWFRKLLRRIRGM